MRWRSRREFIKGLGLASASLALGQDRALRAADASSGTRMDTRKDIVAYSDGFSQFFFGQYRTREDLKASVTNLLDTDVTIFEWALGQGDVMTSATKVGTILGTGVTDEQYAALCRGDKLAAEIVQRLIAEGNDPLTVVAEQGKADGMAIFASFRPCIGAGPPYEPYFAGKFWHDNLDKRILTQDGHVYVPNLSFAYSTVRRFVLDVIAEALERDIAGVTIDYLRHPPFFGFEPPAVASFKARHDVDPPGPEPEVWWRHRAAYLTDMMRKARAILDQAEKRYGHRVRLAARVDHKNHLEWGQDIETWIKEGVLDILIISQLGFGGFEIDLAPFRKMMKGTDCKLFVGEECTLEGREPTPEDERAEARGEKVEVTTRYMTPVELCRRALRWYAEGADGIQFFNGPTDPVLRIAGHTAKIRKYLAEHGESA
jgi:hypothetical protein